MPAASCPFTESAYACQLAIDRAEGWSREALALGIVVDPRNVGTIGSLARLHHDAQRIMRSIEWLRDFCVFAAIHSEEMQRFTLALKSGKSLDEAERVALATSRRRSAPMLVVVGQEARA